MRTRMWARAALLVALGAAGCGRHNEKPSLGKPDPPTTVNVANNGFADVTVYVLQSGMRWRLGTVTGLSHQRFSLRLSHDRADLYLLADPIGGARSYLSPAMNVQPGAAVDLRLHATLSMSSVSVWER
jgi:hypothetical protein